MGCSCISLSWVCPLFLLRVSEESSEPLINNNKIVKDGADECVQSILLRGREFLICIASDKLVRSIPSCLISRSYYIITQYACSSLVADPTLGIDFALLHYQYLRQSSLHSYSFWCLINHEI